MIGRLAALIFISTMTQAGATPGLIPVTVAELGGDLTLTCPVAGDRAGLFFWYKMKAGYMIQTIAKGTHEKDPELTAEFNNPRFTAKAGAEYSLNISDVRKEDEGIYLCQSGSVYEIKMTDATLLVVRDPQTVQELKLEQYPASETFQAGSQTKLQCSLMSTNQGDTGQCLGDHHYCPNVHWIRAGFGQSNASRIYTSGKNSSTGGRSCEYTLSESLDEGTYYCAVATCGKILLGSGTRVTVETGQQPLHLAAVIAVPLLCCVVVIAVLIRARNRKESKASRRCTGATYANQRELYRADEADSNCVDDEDEYGVNYAALNFSLRQWEKRSTQRERPRQHNVDCTG